MKGKIKLGNYWKYFSTEEKDLNKAGDKYKK